MKTFILILLFGRSIMLTPNPIDISSQWVDVPLEKAISAINSGATLNIQLSVNGRIIAEVKNAANHFKKLKELLPDKNIEAVLIDKDGNRALFINKGFSISDSSFNRDDSVWITMTNITDVLADTQFNQLKIRSAINIEKASIVWKNYCK